jgi:outer membrane receptor protein involved in Fe transport
MVPTQALLSATILTLTMAAQAHSPGTISGFVNDATGKPIQGVMVEISEGDLKDLIRLRTGADGAFITSNLVKGRYLIEFKHPGYSIAHRKVDLLERPAEELEQTLVIYSKEVIVEAKSGITNINELDAPPNHLLGIADTASEGIVTPEMIQRRPYQRPGDVLETVPGLLISQHSGQGKANQYYLRGFNLDHGTDLASFVDEMPVNMPTHAHGQGYSDLNFLIPELVDHIQYKKGPYFAEEGDFAAAGAVHLSLVHSLEKNLLELEGGSYGYRRLLAAGSPRIGEGYLLYAVEGVHNNGPWDHGDDYIKANSVLRYSLAKGDTQISFTAMAYTANWNSTDQVPQRAIDQGLISRFGTIDPSDGGNTLRQSLSFDLKHADQNVADNFTAYLINYRLNLFSNFTYFLNDPIHGDQFEQSDRRTISGFRGSRAWSFEVAATPMEATFGLQFRNDNIASLALSHTGKRQILSTTRQDGVIQSSTSPFIQLKAIWTDHFRSIVGVRYDDYHFEVRSDNPSNSGKVNAGLANPKVTLVFGPWRDTEFYLNFGDGFHSNDARGTTITVSPQEGIPVPRVTPLVRAKGYELGLRSTLIPRWQTTLSLWRLDIGSELVFSGDAGDTSPSRPSRRDGLEWSNEIQLSTFASLQADLAYSRARFSDDDFVNFADGGHRIPGAVEGVGQLGLVLRPSTAFQAGFNLRYFGPRPLIEDNTVRSHSATQVQAECRYDLTTNLQMNLELFNLANAKVSDIDYYYTSRLKNEAVAGANDIHTHPVEPRSFRLGLRWKF